MRKPPEAGKVLTLYTIANLLNDGLVSAGLDGVIKAAIAGDKIRLALEPGQSPSTFTINIPAGSPMQSIIGFRDGQESSENADTSVLKVRNQLQPSKAKIDPHGPVDGDRRVFRVAGILIIFIHVSHQDLLICLTSHPKVFLSYCDWTPSR